MLLKYFYDPALAHASYLVGCQRSGEAVVIDPGRHVAPYLAAAEAEGLRIVATAETHIHADFVSGSRELNSQVGAKMYLSDEGTADWKYRFATSDNSILLKGGSKFTIGNIRFEVVHTPGHTPEHISFLLTDIGGGANVPMGIFTGDFVFVGSIGRPDLLETAAGVQGSAVAGARQLYHSMRWFRELPEHLQVWPAHGAGSACGKGLGAIPSTTVGYEKLFNPALQFDDEQSFIDYILEDQPETPSYFAVMKRVNKAGPTLISELKPVVQNRLTDIEIELVSELTIDISPSADFAKGHIPKSVNIPLSMLVQWAGFIVDYERPISLITEKSNLAEALVKLHSIGIDNIKGYYDLNETRATGLRSEEYRSESPSALQERIESGAVKLIDVRAETEFDAGHIAQADHVFLGRLPKMLSQLNQSKPIVVQCQSGARSAIAMSLLQRVGIDAINMEGGYRAWTGAGLSRAHVTQKI
jgi:hydroxyacylglutathione hydrolase